MTRGGPRGFPQDSTGFVLAVLQYHRGAASPEIPLHLSGISRHPTPQVGKHFVPHERTLKTLPVKDVGVSWEW